MTPGPPAVKTPDQNPTDVAQGHPSLTGMPGNLNLVGKREFSDPGQHLGIWVNAVWFWVPGNGSNTSWAPLRSHNRPS